MKEMIESGGIRAHGEVGGVGEEYGPAVLDPLVPARHVALRRLRREVRHDVAQPQHLRRTAMQDRLKPLEP